MIIQGTQAHLAEKAALLLCEAAGLSLKNKSHIVVALPGGRSVIEIYKYLGRQPLAWDRIHFFLLDERLVPTDHPDSNYSLIREHLGGKVPSGMLHRFTHVPDTPEHGVTAYNSELQSCGGRFDIVLAGSGEDGHIASLFPGHPSLLDDTGGYVLVGNAPKPPPGRMSAGVQLIRSAETGILLFFGSGKHAALHGFLDEQRPISECPAKIMAALPNFYLLTDQEIDTS